MILKSNYKTKIRKNAYLIMPVIGIIIIFIMLGIVWFWESNGRELYFYKEVVVLNQDIQSGTIIKEDMLQFQKVEEDKIISQAILTKEEIINLEAKNYIPKGLQLHPQFFESQELIKYKGAYIVRIPNEWLYSIPNTIRRKDSVVFYQVDFDKNNNSVTEDIENIINKNPIFETKIAYVKDSANREIKTVSTEDRIDGSSIISEVLIVATPEEFKILENAVNSGSKLIIMYSEGG